MIGRRISRARGRALRAAGVPNLPNLPSPRALAQNELRGIRRPSGSGGRRRAGSTANGSAAVRRPSGRPAGSNPYEDESRDVGEGPDELTRFQGFILLFGVILALYLLASWGAPPAAPDTGTVGHCHTCEE